MRSRHPPRALLRGLVVLMTAALGALAPRPALGQEDIQAFRLRSVDGWLSGGYELDEEVFRKDGRVAREVTEREWFEELKLGGTASVYHPRFLLIDGHVLVRLEQGEREAIPASLAQGGEDELVNEYDLRLDFLPEHPYPLTLWGRRHTTSVDSEFAYDTDVTTEEMGALLRWNNKWVPMSLSAEQEESRERGISPFDEETRRVIYQATQQTQRRRSLFEYEFEEIERESLLTHTRTEATRQKALLTNLIAFGEKQRSRFNNRFSFRDFENSTDQREILGGGDLRLYHRPTFQTHYRYQSRYTETEFERQLSHQGSVGFSHRLYRNLTTNFAVSGSVADSDTGLTWQPRTRLSFDYVRSIPYGSVTARAHGDFTFRDEDFITDVGQELDESHAFDTSNLIRLNNEFVRTETIVVTDGSGSTLYVENVDYRIQLVGTQTEIVRLLAGTIPPGGAVLVDYEFQRSRDRRFYTINRGVGFGLNLFRALRLYTSYRRRDRHLLRGLELGGEDDTDDWIAGVSFNRWGLHLTAEHEEYDSELSPRLTDRLNGSFTLRLPFRSSLSASASWSHTEYPNDRLRAAVDPSIRDFSEVVTYRARFTTNPLRNLFVEGGARFREEEGRSESEEMVFFGRLRLRIRKVELIIRGERRLTEDRLGEAFERLQEREQDKLEIELIRRF